MLHVLPPHPSGVGRAPQGLWVQGSSVESGEDTVLFCRYPEFEEFADLGCRPRRSDLDPRGSPSAPSRTGGPGLCRGSPVPTVASEWPRGCGGYLGSASHQTQPSYLAGTPLQTSPHHTHTPSVGDCTQPPFPGLAEVPGVTCAGTGIPGRARKPKFPRALPLASFP